MFLDRELNEQYLNTKLKQMNSAITQLKLDENSYNNVKVEMKGEEDTQPGEPEGWECDKHRQVCKER